MNSTPSSSPKPQASGRNQRRLKNIVVDWNFQIKYIILFALTGFIFMGLTLLFFLYVGQSILMVIRDAGQEILLSQIQIEIYSGFYKLLLVCGFFVLLISVFGLIMSHRIVGPMYHLKKVFREIRAGDLNRRAHLREKDEFKDVATEFNQMMDSLTKK